MTSRLLLASIVVSLFLVDLSLFYYADFRLLLKKKISSFSKLEEFSKLLRFSIVKKVIKFVGKFLYGGFLTD